MSAQEHFDIDLRNEVNVALTAAKESHTEAKVGAEEAYWEGVQQNALENARIDRMRALQDMRLRDTYAGKAYDLAAWGVWFWFAAFAAYAVVLAIWKIEIFNDKVMISITAGATINVAAAFLGVIKGLFPATATPQIRPKTSAPAPKAKPVPAKKTQSKRKPPSRSASDQGS